MEARVSFGQRSEEFIPSRSDPRRGKSSSGYAACSKVMCTYMIRRRNCNHVTGVNAVVGTLSRASSAK